MKWRYEVIRLFGGLYSFIVMVEVVVVVVVVFLVEGGGIGS